MSTSAPRDRADQQAAAEQQAPAEQQPQSQPQQESFGERIKGFFSGNNTDNTPPAQTPNATV